MKKNPVHCIPNPINIHGIMLLNAQMVYSNASAIFEKKHSDAIYFIILLTISYKSYGFIIPIYVDESKRNRLIYVM